MRLKLLQRLRGIVDEGEAGALAAAVLRAEAEAGDAVFGAFVEFGELGAHVVFAYVGALGVEDVARGVVCVSLVVGVGLRRGEERRWGLG